MREQKIVEIVKDPGYPHHYVRLACGHVYDAASVIVRDVKLGDLFMCYECEEQDEIPERVH